MGLRLLPTLSFVTILGTAMLAGCAAPAETDGGSQEGASAQAARQTRSVKASASVLGSILSSENVYTSDEIVWSIVQIAVPVDLVGNDRQLVIVANGGGLTRVWELDQISGVAVKSPTGSRGSFALEIERDYRGEGGLASEKLELTVGYQVGGATLDETLTLTSKDGVEKKKASSDAKLQDLNAVATVHEPLGKEPELRLLQLVGDAAVNPIALHLAARSGQETAHFDLGIRIGDVHEVKALPGNKLEIGAVQESLDGDGNVSERRGVRYEVAIDAALGTASITTL